MRSSGGQISVHENGLWQTWEGLIKDLSDRNGKTIFVSHPDVHVEMRDFIGDPKDWVLKEG
ncbi:MAG: hypothetical protein RLZZ230_156 [Candidatus Parcubacteria bacterium]